MKEMTINYKNGTIEMSVGFEKKAKIFGSAEYEKLMAARRDFPGYRPVVKKIHSGDHMKGLTLEYMENYIKNHAKDFKYTVVNDDGSETEETSQVITAFYELCGRDESGKKIEEIKDVASYGEIKAFFLSQYPELKSKNHNKIEGILKTAKKAA